MSTHLPDALLEKFTRGFAFDECVQQQLNYDLMCALADMFMGWTMRESCDPKRSAWLTCVAEGLLAEADHLGPDWTPTESEKLSLTGFLGRKANGDKIRPAQTPRGS